MNRLPARLRDRARQETAGRAVVVRDAPPERRRSAAENATPPTAGHSFLADLRTNAGDIGLCTGLLLAAALAPLIPAGGIS